MGEPFEPRWDFSADSLCIVFPVPAELASQFPDDPEVGPAHVTAVYIKHSTEAELALAVSAIQAAIPELLWTTVALGPLSYFENDQRVAHCAIEADPKCVAVRNRLAEDLAAVGLDVSRAGEEWVPHATLGYLEPGAEWAGAVPSGSWTVDSVEIWRGDERIVLGADGRMEKLSRADFGEPDEATIKAWLVEHVSDNRKMPRPRMLVLKALEDRYPYLKPPPVEQVFRGLRNIEPGAVTRWASESDPVQDKSWSATRGPAERFARGEWTLETPISGKTGVLLTAKADLAMLLLNPDLLAALPGVGDVVHPIWNEPLSKAIRDEQEVLVLDSLPIVSAEAVPMIERKADAAHRRADIAVAKQQVLFDIGRAPAVHTDSRTKTFDTVRADKIELPTDHAPILHPYGWVTYPVLFSRANNIQVYDGVREFRPARSVFDRASMDSGQGAPWELRHSDDLLNPHTVLGKASGVVLTVDEYHDGLHTFGWARAWDRGIQYAIEGVDGQRPEAPEVSVAFGCRVHRSPGTDDYGNPFDQWIDNITWNSLASEPYGRAGTAKVLTGRADTSVGITVHGADELLALSQRVRPSAAPVFFDPCSYARFDSARSPRPSLTTTVHEDAHMLKKLIPIALQAGVSEEAVAKAIGMKVEEIAAFMEGEADLTPDQLNALVMAMPEPKAPAAAAPAAVAAPTADSETAKIKIGEVEHEVPKAVAEHIAALEGRADRAGARANKAETDLGKAERDLVIARDESTKRSDAMSKMVTHVDAEKMANERGMHIANSIELARRVHGHEWSPENRKDAASGEALALSSFDWEMAAIRGAFGDQADKIIQRIDAAPTPEARAYAINERLADAREILDRRDHKGTDVIKSVESMRTSNALADKTRLDGDEDDPLASAQRAQRHFSAQPVGAPQPQTTTGAA